MDFNLQAYQADHLLHLSAKPQRRLTVQENAHHRWLEIDGVVQSAMSLAEPATLCLPHQQVIACLLPEQAGSILELGLGAAISPAICTSAGPMPVTSASTSTKR